MSKALDLIRRVNELSYYGMHNDYSNQPYDQDAAEYQAPFADLQLPDKSGGPDMQQTRSMVRKSRGEDGQSVNN